MGSWSAKTSFLTEKIICSTVVVTVMKPRGLRWDGNREIKRRIVKNGNGRWYFLSVIWLDKFVQREDKGIQIRCVRKKRSIKRDIKLPVAILDIRDVPTFPNLSLIIIFVIVCVTLTKNTILNLLNFSIYEKYLHLPKQLKPQTSNLNCVFSYKVFLWTRLIYHLQINTVSQNPLNRGSYRNTCLNLH